MRRHTLNINLWHWERKSRNRGSFVSSFVKEKRRAGWKWKDPWWLNVQDKTTSRGGCVWVYVWPEASEWKMEEKKKNISVFPKFLWKWSFCKLGCNSFISPTSVRLLKRHLIMAGWYSHKSVCTSLSLQDSWEQNMEYFLSPQSLFFPSLLMHLALTEWTEIEMTLCLYWNQNGSVSVLY